MVGVLGAMGALLVSSPALGAVIEPNTFGDENGGGTGCSLREAILAANNDAAFGGCPAGSGADTISLGAGTYGLSIPPGTTGDDKLDGDLYVASQLTITHAGVTPAAIDGGGIDRVIHVLGAADLTASGFTIRNGRTGQSGAGIRNEGNLSLSNATVSGNETTASYGGGIANAGTATMSLTNVTVSGNRAEGDGGGIDQGIGGRLDLSNVTIAGNTTDISGDTGGGGGIFNAGGTINVKNTIIAQNYDNTSDPIVKSPDCGGAALTSGRNNLIGDAAGCDFLASAGDTINVKPRLAPLADNGGPTLTHALLAGSPAIKSRGGSATGRPARRSAESARHRRVRVREMRGEGRQPGRHRRQGQAGRHEQGRWHPRPWRKGHSQGTCWRGWPLWRQGQGHAERRQGQGQAQGRTRQGQAQGRSRQGRADPVGGLAVPC